MASKLTLDSIFDKIQSKIKNPEELILKGERKTDAISSGSLLLDSICAGGLLHKGRMTEISGAEGSSKTTLCLQSTAQALAKGKMVIFFDFEQAFHINYAKALGVELKNPNLKVIQPTNLEEGLEIVKMLEKQIPDNDGNIVMIFDSIAAMKPRKLLEASGEQQQIGLHAQRVGEFSAYLNATWCGKKKAYILFTNQIRRVPSAGGVFQAKALKDSGIGFGASSDTSITTTGGIQLRYMLSLRVMLDYAGKIEEGSYNDGNLVRSGSYIRALTIKNRLVAPFQNVKMAVIYGEGISDRFAILETLREYEYITQGGAVFTYIDNEENEVGSGLSFKMKGKEAFYEKLKEPEYQEDMKKTYKDIMENQEAIEVQDGDEDEVEEQDIEENDFDEDDE